MRACVHVKVHQKQFCTSYENIMLINYNQVFSYRNSRMDVNSFISIYHFGLNQLYILYALCLLPWMTSCQCCYVFLLLGYCHQTVSFKLHLYNYYTVSLIFTEDEPNILKAQPACMKMCCHFTNIFNKCI